MTETFTALLLAHALAGFLFQSRWMAANRRHPGALLLNPVIVLATAVAALGLWLPVQEWIWPLGALTAAHLLTGIVTSRTGDGLTAFLIDQAVNLAILLTIATWRPDLWTLGHWPEILPSTLAPWVPVAMAYTAGLVLTVRAGGVAVDKLLAPFKTFWNRYNVLTGGLKQAGRLIGELERALTFILVATGNPTGVAILIAAKSLMRFNATGNDRHIAEYVIIGTLASVGWALVVSYGTTALVTQLRPLPL